MRRGRPEAVGLAGIFSRGVRRYGLEGACLLVCALALRAEESDCSVRVWQTEDGLPQNSVTSIAQTKDGYLWLATFKGVARFDGVRFTVFDDHNTGALTSSSIIRLDLDSEGGLWVITQSGGLARMVHNRFIGFTAREGLPASGVLAVAQAPDGRIWLRDKAGGLHTFQNGRIMPVGGLERSGGGALGSFGFDEEGTLWTRQGRRLVRYEAGRFVPLLRADGQSEAVVRAFGRGGHGGLVLITSLGLQHYRRGKWEGASTPCPAEMRNLTCVFEDRRGQTWVGTYGNGLFRYDDATGWRRFTTGDGLLHNAVRSVYEDREGNVWVGTDGAGLHLFKPRLFRTYEAKDGLTGSVVMSVSEGPTGVLWLGLNGGGVNCLEGRFKALAQTPVLETNDFVYSVLADRSGTVWVGTYDRGLVQYRDGQFERAPLGAGVGAVLALFQDRAGAIWAGGPGGLWQIRAGRSTSVRFQAESPVKEVRALGQDSTGALYVGTDGAGVYRLEPAAVEFGASWPLDRVSEEAAQMEGAERIANQTAAVSSLHENELSHFTELEGLGDNHVSCLYVDAEDNVWIGGVSAGLSRLHQGRLDHYTTRIGLPSDRISSIVEDDQGRLWLGCERGIFWVERGELGKPVGGRDGFPSFHLYDSADGLSGVECSGNVQPACCKARDGRLWFATVKGVAMVDPKSLPSNRRPPPVAIEELVLDDQSMVSSDWSAASGPGSEARYQKPPAGSRQLPETSRESSALDQMRTVRIPHRVHRVQIRYTGLSFTAPGKVRFRYRLEGFDGDYVEAGARRIAEYTKIPPGQYTFHVKACNNDGLWNEAGASLGLVVLAPWWMTWWFRALALAGALGLVFWIVEARVRRVKREHAAQRALSRRLIETQEAERKRIAAELHDSLGQDLLVIKNRALLGLQEAVATRRSTEQFGEISRVASSSLAEVRQISHDLRPYQLDRLGLTKALQSMVTRVSAASGVRCMAQIDSLDGMVPASMEIHLYRVVQELLNNVVKHSHASEARVVVKVQDGKIHLVVADDGCGFDPATAGEGSPGAGLTDITERVRILGGSVNCESHRAQGTKWTLEIPTHNPSAP